MIKLLELHIQGFKDSQREILINFSNEPISVIYGENGSGKTTLLKIIHAILSKDENILIQENVKKISIKFQVNKEIKNAIIEIEKEKVNWGNIKSLYNSTSILFGVNRGIIENFNEKVRLQNILEQMYKRIHQLGFSRIETKYLDDLDMYLNSALTTINHSIKNIDYLNQNHLSVDSIAISEIEKIIIQQYIDGEMSSSIYC